MFSRNFIRTSIAAILVISFLLNSGSASAQYIVNSDSAFKAGVPNSGRIWGYAFGDYYYKAHADTANRGGNNQYTGIAKGSDEFQFRRIYLGYDYNISKRFVAELLLAAEDNVVQGNNPPTGDLLSDNKLTFYIKLANIRWKQIFKGTDLVVGQVSTPAFPLLSEKVWAYRSIERTIADIRRTPSFDLGATLQGSYLNDNFGYNAMVGNGTSAKPENDKYKWYYADVWAKFFDKHLIVDFYADYERIAWNPIIHHSRQMIKGYLAYQGKNITVGAEGFMNKGKSDVVGTGKLGIKDTLDAHAQGLSFYVRGTIVKDKLGFFARYDTYNPDKNYNANQYTKYSGLTSNYEPNNKEQFVTAGLDFTPIKNVHFMPNVWWNHYDFQGNGGPANSYDLVYRMTFYFTFGK